MKIKIYGIPFHDCHLYLLKISNELTFIYEDMGPFICAHLLVLKSVFSSIRHVAHRIVYYSPPADL